MNDTSTPQRINFYAAFGVGLAVSLSIVVAILATLWATARVRASWQSDFDITVYLLLASLCGILFFGLATLLGSKYGWRTVVTSFIVQGVVLLAAFCIVAEVTSAPPPVDRVCFAGTCQ